MLIFLKKELEIFKFIFSIQNFILYFIGQFKITINHYK